MTQAAGVAQAGPIRVGEFPVRATRAEALAFCAALGATGSGQGSGPALAPATRPGDLLPHTLPVRWLLGAEVRAALLVVLGPLLAGRALVHLEQRITLERPLRAETDYSMVVSVRLPEAGAQPAAPQSLAKVAETEPAPASSVIRVEATVCEVTGREAKAANPKAGGASAKDGQGVPVAHLSAVLALVPLGPAGAAP